MNHSYAAGILDGEGCVGFTWSNTTLQARVIVTNTNLDMLVALKEKYGGDINEVAHKNPRWKRSYNWRLMCAAAVNFLKAVYPDLIIKRKQAEAVFVRDVIRPGQGRAHDRPAMELLAEQMHWLNKKGPEAQLNESPADVALTDKEYLSMRPDQWSPKKAVSAKIATDRRARKKQMAKSAPKPMKKV